MEAFEQIMRLVIQPSGNAPIHQCMLYLHDPQQDFKYVGTTGQVDDAGEPLSPAHRFRTGSITKVFTATLIFQLMEEKVLSLNEPLLDRLSTDKRHFLQNLLQLDGVPYAHRITIGQLLNHRSGLRDYFSDDSRFFERIIRFPAQSWTWQAVMESYFEYGLHEKSSFKPGEAYHYADTNYLLLAVLIEELCDQPFHEVLEGRILSPLGLHESFLEFFQADKSSSPIAFPFYGPQILKEVNTSFDWGGGGLISSAEDLDVFIRALFAGRLFREKTTLQKMLVLEETGPVSKRGSSSQGLGLQQKTIGGRHFLGHSSAYAAMMWYEPARDISIILSLNQAAALHKAEWLMYKVEKLL